MDLNFSSSYHSILLRQRQPVSAGTFNFPEECRIIRIVYLPQTTDCKNLAFYHLYSVLFTFFSREAPRAQPVIDKIRRFSAASAIYFCLHKVFDNFTLQTVIHIFHRVLHTELHDVQQHFFHLSTKFSTTANRTFQLYKIRLLFYIISTRCRGAAMSSLFFLLTCFWSDCSACPAGSPAAGNFLPGFVLFCPKRLEGEAHVDFRTACAIY